MCSLKQIQETLLQGQQLAMQGSYQRRAPTKKAIPYLLKARKELKDFVNSYPTNAQAWRLLSQAEEYLLNYSDAILTLQKAINLDQKDKKDLKRLAKLKEYGGQWEDLDMSSRQLELLKVYLENQIEFQGCDHTLTLTKKWLSENVSRNKQSKITKALRNQGGFCDCEVLLNVME
ncbi:DUF2695 domain-containing protein [Priestia flexa]|uniref:DUF2695 domain-containing protein n=1 Tax=Priestia flexa TaxID=86664 RepID=A0A8I1MI57_9BACI|nr:DUF2695 domain-containing protein [Priestia flexa]MBN8253617.1 DUF2695 domain-containing protein [Priestia flexa]MBY6087851.1 DUF2695 domain-containing protein [Priestia flexa]MEC0668408.1 DUF2695 domain-containing protein [Priestia flexa]MED3826030.1 DUF2695 domain-containing protein [Priestia flexa]